MTLQDISDISQAVAAVAVLVSLVLVGIQLRMNAKQQREANILARIQIKGHVTSDLKSHISRLMDRDFATIFRKVMFDKAELTPVEVTQILTYFLLSVRNYYLAYSASDHDLVDQLDLQILETNLLWHLTAPLFAGEWQRLQRDRALPDSMTEHLNRRFAEQYPGHAPLAVPQAPEIDSDPAAA